MVQFKSVCTLGVAAFAALGAAAPAMLAERGTSDASYDWAMCGANY
jgi:triacylglycerol lipase